MSQWWRFFFTNHLGLFYHFVMLSEGAELANSFCAAEFEKNVSYALIFVIFVIFQLVCNGNECHIFL